MQSKQREGLAGGGSTSVHRVHSHQRRVSSAPAGRCWSCVLLSPCLPSDPHPLWHKGAVQCHHHHFQRRTNLRSRLYRSDCRKPQSLTHCTSSWYQSVQVDKLVVYGDFRSHHSVWWLLNLMKYVVFIDVKYLLLLRSSSSTALVPSCASLVSSMTGAALFLLKAGIELSLVDQGLGKKSIF